MRKHGGTPSRRDKHVTLAAISPPGVARGRFVRGQQSGLAGSKPPPLFTRGASSCSSQGRRQGEPWGASPRPSAPTYVPTSDPRGSDPDGAGLPPVAGGRRATGRPQPEVGGFVVHFAAAGARGTEGPRMESVHPQVPKKPQAGGGLE